MFQRKRLLKSAIISCAHAILRCILNAQSDDVVKQTGCSVVVAKLDYCNSLMYGAPASTPDKLQRVQNQLTRIATKSRWRTTPTDAASILRMNWRPIGQRTSFKLPALRRRQRVNILPRCCCRHDAGLTCGRQRRNACSRDGRELRLQSLSPHIV